MNCNTEQPSDLYYRGNVAHSCYITCNQWRNSGDVTVWWRYVRWRAGGQLLVVYRCTLGTWVVDRLLPLCRKSRQQQQSGSSFWKCTKKCIIQMTKKEKKEPIRRRQKNFLLFAPSENCRSTFYNMIDFLYITLKMKNIY